MRKLEKGNNNRTMITVCQRKILNIKELCTETDYFYNIYEREKLHMEDYFTVQKLNIKGELSSFL